MSQEQGLGASSQREDRAATPSEPSQSSVVSGVAGIPCADATYSELGNNLYWKLFAGEDGFIRWTGYDDAYWWKGVATTEQFRRRVGPVSGRVFRLDPDTCRVEIEQVSA